MVRHAFMSFRYSAIAMLAFVAVLLFAGQAAARQSSAVSVHVNAPSTAYVRDPFELQLIIRNARSAPRPAVPSSPMYEVQDTAGTTTSTTIVNGVVSQVVGYKYAVTARQVGDITIEPFEVIADGQPFTTNPVTVKIIAPSTSESFKLEIVPEKTRIYVGEPIRIRATLQLGKRIKTLAFTAPELPSALEVLEAPDPRPPGAHPQDPRYLRLNIGGETVTATVSSATAGNQRTDQLQFDRLILARHPGRLKIDATIARFDVVTGQRQARFTDGPFADLDVTEKQMAISEPFELEVLPLPEAGRPADFSGLVGSYTVTASADPREASIGEPITLRVTVNGPPPLSLIPLLDLTAQPNLAASFRVPREPALPALTPIGAMFTYPIRARKPGDQQIPPIELSYFDTSSAQYKRARSEPIRISIRPAPGVEFTDGDEPELAADRSAGGPAARVDTTPLTFASSNFSWLRAARSPITWSIVLGPSLLYLVFAAAWSYRRRVLADPAARRRRRAIRVASRHLRAIANAADGEAAAAGVASVLTNLAADWFNRPASSLTSEQALELLATERDPFAGELRQLLAECDRIRFAADRPQVAPPQSLVTRTRELLARLTASLPSRKEQSCA